MSVSRRLVAERIENLHLARGVGQVVIAAYDMSHSEIGIIEHGREVVSRNAVGAEDYQVVEFAVFEYRPPLDQIINHGLPGLRRAKANRVIASGRPVRQRDFGQLRSGSTFAAAAVVAGLAMLLLGLLAHRLQLLGRAIAGISLALPEQPGCAFAV